MDNKYNIAETVILISLQCFRAVIPDYVQSGTQLNIFLLICDTISDNIIPDNDVASLLATLLSTIFIQFHGALTILIDDVVVDLAFLIFQEVSGPHNLCQDIVDPDKLSLVELLFFLAGLHLALYGYHGHESTSVTNHILYIPQTVNQHTILYFLTFLLTGSVADQW